MTEIVERLGRWMRPSTQPVYLRLEHPVQDDIAAAADEIIQLRQALRDVLAHDFAEECQECAIGRSDAWQRAREAID